MTSVEPEIVSLEAVDQGNIDKLPKILTTNIEEGEQQTNPPEQNGIENRDGQEPNLIKKRKINDSLNHVTAERVGRIREINPESILEHLREIATYGDKCQLNDESEKALEQVLEYKQNAHDLVINEELLQGRVCEIVRQNSVKFVVFSMMSEVLKNFLNKMHRSREQHELTPTIFTKKTSNTARMSKNMQGWMIGFENYLNMVAQLYYKKNFNIREMLIIPGETRDVVVQNSLNTTTNGEKKKRGRKNTSKAAIAQKEAFSASTNEDSSNKKSGSNVGNQNNSNHQPGRRGRPSHHQEDKKKDQPEYNFSKEEIQLSILDHLINPLKTDYAFELWSPKEVAIFECAMCKFGKQFGFIAALIGTKTHRDVFEFYLMWKGTSHYKIWKMHKNIGNRNNHSHLV